MPRSPVDVVHMIHTAMAPTNGDPVRVVPTEAVLALGMDPASLERAVAWFGVQPDGLPRLLFLGGTKDSGHMAVFPMDVAQLLADNDMLLVTDVDRDLALPRRPRPLLCGCHRPFSG